MMSSNMKMAMMKKIIMASCFVFMGYSSSAFPELVVVDAEYGKCTVDPDDYYECITPFTCVTSIINKSTKVQCKTEALDLAADYYDVPHYYLSQNNYCTVPWTMPLFSEWQSFMSVERMSVTYTYDCTDLDLPEHSYVTVATIEPNEFSCPPPYQEAYDMGLKCQAENSIPTRNWGLVPAATETKSFSFTAKFTDSDNFPDLNLTYEIFNLPGWASYDEYTGWIHGTPSIGDATNSAITITVKADDGGSTGMGVFLLEVKPANKAPTISASPPQAIEGVDYSFTVDANDEDDYNGLLTYSIENEPFWSSFNTNTGELTGVPDSSGNVTNIIVTVEDPAGATASDTFTINVDTIPIARLGGPFEVEANKPFTIDGSASYDIDPLDALTYQWDLGLLEGSYGGSSTDVLGAPHDHYDVTLTVTDSGGLSSSVSSTIRVVGYNPELNLGSTDCGPLNNGSNPINSATGNKFQPEVDYIGTGPLPLNYTRYYNSLSSVNTLQGNKWIGSYDRQVFVDGSDLDVIRVARGNGSVITFNYEEVEGVWQATKGIKDRLEAAGDGWTFITPQNLFERYDAAGKLQRIENMAGQALVLTYAASGRLDHVTDNAGRSLRFRYSDVGNDLRLESVIDPAGRSIIYGYDAPTGNLTRVTYQDNHYKTYVYDNARFANALTGIIDENGHRYATWGYDEAGRANLSHHAEDANRVEFSYETDTRTEVTDAKGKGRFYNFVNHEGLKKVETIDGVECTVCGGMGQDNTYDSNGYLDVVTDFNNKKVDYTFNAQGLLLQRIDAFEDVDVERTSNFTWHETFKLMTCSEEPMRTTLYNYYEEPHANMGLLHQVIAIDTTDLGMTNCEEVRAAYLEDTTGWNVREIAYTYYIEEGAKQGLLHTVNGPLAGDNDVITYEYHATGDLYEIQQPHGMKMRYTDYDAHGRALTITDASNVKAIVETIVTYSDRGWLKTMREGNEQSDYSTTIYEHDNVGNIIKASLPTGEVTHYFYDQAHRLTDKSEQRDESGNPTGNRVHYVLDKLGNVTHTTHYGADGKEQRIQSFVFNDENRLEFVKNAAEEVIRTYGYDDNGNLTTDKNTQGTTTYTPDALNRVHVVKDAHNNETTYYYDGQGNVERVETPKGITYYKYDGLGNLKQLDSPDTGTTEYQKYDAAGNVLKVKDARDIIVDYKYDYLSRLIEITSDTASIGGRLDGTLKYFDYGCGRGGAELCYAVNSGVSYIDWGFDNKGRVIRRHQIDYVVGANTYIDYIYHDKSDNLKYMVLPSGYFVEFAYSNGKVSSVHYSTEPAEGTSNYYRGPPGDATSEVVMENITYDAFGPMNGWNYGNGAAMTRNYDLDGQLEDYTLSESRIDLTYYPTGMVETISSSNTPGSPSFPMQSYQYDALARLTHVNSTDPTYSYDALGNRESYTPVMADAVSYGIALGSNRLINVDGNPDYGYDGAGNVENNGKNTFHYNPAGGLEIIDADTNKELKYGYNIFGQRTAKEGSQDAVIGDANVNGLIDRSDVLTVADATMERIPPQLSYDCNQDTDLDAVTVYIKVSGQDIVCVNNIIDGGEVDVMASARIHYVYDDQQRLIGEYSEASSGSGIPISEYIWLGNMPVAVVKNREVYYVQSDHLNTPRLITDSENKAVWEWSAAGSPFGDTPANADPDGDGEMFNFNLRFPGQYYDAESGLHYNYNRTYDPSTGRYLQSDPIGLAGGLNTYVYVGNNPLNFIDPLGLSPCTFFPWGTIACVAIAVVGTTSGVKQCSTGLDDVQQGLNDAKEYREEYHRTIECIMDPLCSSSQAQQSANAAQSAYQATVVNAAKATTNLATSVPGTFGAGPVPTNLTDLAVGAAVNTAASQ